MRPALLGALLATGLAGSALAQVAPETATSGAVSERTRRDAERPLLWIRQHAERPRALEPRRGAALLARPVAGGYGALLQAAPPAAGRAVATEVAPEPLPGPAPEPLPALPTAPDSLAISLPQPTQAAAQLPAAPLLALESPEPELNSALLRRVRRGSVQVRLSVGPDGQVLAVELVGSSHPALAAPVLDAARRWRFEAPGRPAETVLDFRIDPEG